ncbi:MAG: hypothetical protein H0T79_03625, partial [Deltaproteobacteria bacterium]|nr:hypothetical protein [Deltaproteobacteria bacterium]
SQRGGSVMDAAVDSIGASPAIGVELYAGAFGALNVTAGPRIDLRVQSMQGTLPVRRAGLGAIAGLDVTFANVPITAGLRYELGVTDLYPSTHDGALIAELGFDWR